MAAFSDHWALAFGLLGNIVSFMVFLAPVPTFYQVYKKKSTEGFQSVPYVVALFSCILWIYYALLKTNVILLITINSAGCFIETIYICFYLFYATKKAKIQTVQLFVLLNVVGFGLIFLLTHFFAQGAARATIVGWICLVFSLIVFIAPLCIVRKVIRTKSVEYMPFLLSFFLTISAVIWLFYGLLLKDYNIAIPNVLGFTFGVLQMLLYVMYKNKKKVVVEEQKMQEIKTQIIILEDEAKLDPELTEQIIDIVKLSKMVCSEMIAVEPSKSSCGQEAVGDQALPKQSIPAGLVEV